VNLDISDKSIPVFAALASPVRIKIIKLLSKKKMNVKEISEALGLSSPITLSHLKKLEDADIIRTEKRGNQRISILKIDTIRVEFPKQIYVPYESYDLEIPIGQYTRYSVEPPCGLAGKNDFIGKVDNPKYFMDPGRIHTGMLWFSKGYVEYEVPNYLTDEQQLEMIELTVELSSEFPFSNNNWLSDITVSLDGKEIGTWTSPGDFSDTRGRLTPDWVYDDMNQYGMLKNFRISKHGSFLDGHHSADTVIGDIDLSKNSWTLRFEVKPTAEHVGGCTIYGNGFGNYDQAIKGKFYYK
jgi:predicted transcriptional regulator